MDWDNVVADQEMILPVHFTSGRTARIDKIVLHHNGGNLSIGDCYNVWCNREASAHYQVQEDGMIGQIVNDCDTAWHAGNANPSSIGIEHANDNFGPWTISQATLESGAHLVAALCKMYGLGEPQWCVNVFPHSYFMATDCPGEIAGSQNEQYMNRAREWYAQMTGGNYTPQEPSQPAQPQPQPGGTGVSVTLQAWSQDQGILPAVTNNEDNAGDGSPILYLSAWTSAGTLDVQANDLPVLKNPCNINDTENGAVGDGGWMTKLYMYLWSPNNDQAIYYRVMVNGEWLAWMKDDYDTGGSGDTYAGNGVDPIQRVEAYIDWA